MFAPPLSAMLPVFSNNHSELNASAPVSLIAFPVQAKHYFTNFVAGLSEPFAAFPELFAAILKVRPQFLGNDLCACRRSIYRQAENYQQSKRAVSFHGKPPPSFEVPRPKWVSNASGQWLDFESKFGLARRVKDPRRHPRAYRSSANLQQRLARSAASPRRATTLRSPRRIPAGPPRRLSYSNVGIPVRS